MSCLKVLSIAALCFGLTTASVTVPAQIAIGIGVAPICPYGYFDYAPYSCSPYGYYGPDWFDGGLFIGAGPWFPGRHGFCGHVDNRFDPHNGYAGPIPGRGDRPFNHLQANEARIGRDTPVTPDTAVVASTARGLKVVAAEIAVEVTHAEH